MGVRANVRRYDDRNRSSGAGARAHGHDATPADVFVVFGITGDLAKVMTFRSLYRLERRGLLDCPIVGVAVDDWTRRRPARARARGDRGDRRDARRRRSSSASPRGCPTSRGDFGDPATYERVADRDRRRAQRRSSTSRSRRSCSAPSSRGSPTPGLTENARVVVEKPFGHDLASARALAAELHAVHRRVAAVPDRPLPRQDGPGRDPLPALRQHDARAGLEPQPRRVACRSRWPRASASRTAATSTTRSARCATSSSTTSCRWSRRRDGAAGRRATRRRSRTRMCAVFRAMPDADPAHYVRGQYDGYRDIDGVARRLDDRDLRRAAAGDRQLALGGRAVLHPHRQAPAGHADRGAAGVPAARRGSASLPAARARPSPTSS